MIISPMNVTLIDSMGSDVSVVNAARVSFNKESDYEQEFAGYDAWGNSQFNESLGEKDAKLINYLAKHNHFTPFCHSFLSFRIKAPVFVARQLVKHQVGLSWNEVSRRYVDSEPEFYNMSWRVRAENAKQGSGAELVREDNKKLFDEVNAVFWDAVEECFKAYDKLLALGIAPEQARAVLNLNHQTEWIWSGSLMAFARVVRLRTDPHSQKETQDVAHLINGLVPEQFNHSWQALLA